MDMRGHTNYMHWKLLISLDKNLSYKCIKITALKLIKLQKLAYFWKL